MAKNTCRNPACTYLSGGRCARAAEISDTPELSCPDLVIKTDTKEAVSELDRVLEALVEAARKKVPVESANSKEHNWSQPLAEAAPAGLQPLQHGQGPQALPLPRSDARGIGALDSAETPWQGGHLDLRQVDHLLWSSPARVFGVLGAFNAGKTSLLTSYFLQIATGQRGPLSYRFTSSLSLRAWKNLIDQVAVWKGLPSEQLLAHTPKESESALFLHLGVSPPEPSPRRHIDLLYSDLPGEWVTEWATVSSEENKNRLQFFERCNGFVVVVDGSELMKSNRVDADTSRIIRRLGEGDPHRLPKQSLALVITKFDLIIDQSPVPPPSQRGERSQWGPLGQKMARTWNALDELKKKGVTYRVFPVSAFPHPLTDGQPVGVVDPFAWLVTRADPMARWGRYTPPIPEGASAFQTMRRWDP